MSQPAGSPVQKRFPWLRGLVATLLSALGLAVAAVFWLNRLPDLPHASAPVADADTLARGAYLARVGNCAGCHTVRGGQPFAGGRGVPTPFGTVFAGNLTPDPDTGLGLWSADDFWLALHHGRSRDGRLLAPAFPYTAFTHVSRADSDALYVFLRSLPPVQQANPASGLRFPFSTQAALAVWRALYFRPAPPDAPAAEGATAQLQRGAYLVRGLGHCAACHAPRNAWGATQQAEQLPGGSMATLPWFAPSLAPFAGVAPDHQQQDLMALLRTGSWSRGTAAGPMAEVVTHSTQYWTDQDLEAASVYLLSLAPQGSQTHQETRSQPSAADAQRIQEQLQRGDALYAERCASCHGEQGEGAVGAYPALAGNLTVNLPDAVNALQVIRHGGFAPSTRAQPRPFGMPPSDLSAQEMADVLTFVRRSWGNQASAVTVLESLRAP